jgi:pimeloyl-ACP methyl ester carboxylesterase
MSLFIPNYEKGFVDTPDGAQVPYVIIGDGPIPRVVIPGAGDGLSLVTDAALNLALFYRKQADRYRLLVLSRRHPFVGDCGMEAQANDMICAMDKLGFSGTVVECNSAGGPVGQWLAAKRPDLVAGLVLSVTLHRSNLRTSAVVQEWLGLVEQACWPELTMSTIEHTFTPKTVARYRLARPLLRFVAPPPKYPERVRNLLFELLDFDNRAILSRIGCPTLVSGGEDDRIIPVEIQREMAELIPQAELQLYPGYGHGNDQENPAYRPALDVFVDRVMGR